ncbi:hypothetical protein [Microbacterium sp. USHLN186]|uniref:hypothetical protein n=1 Tax=Microbacterium sp. USHLN186 TaxID=3081286 RepID=UPI003015BBB4
MLLVLSVSILSVGLPVFLLADIDDVARSEAWTVTLGLMVWAGVRLSLLWVAGVPRLFDFFFWLFTYIFMGIAPTAQIRSGLTSTTTPGVDPNLDLPAAGVVALGVACYEIGRLIWLHREHREVLHAQPKTRSVSKWRTVALFIVALALSGFVVSRLGVTIFQGSRDAAAAARAAAWPDPAVRSLTYASGIYPMVVAVGALLQLRRASTTSASRQLAIAGAVMGGAVLLLIVNPVTSARYSFGTIAFALVVYAGALTTTARARVAMAAVIAGFLFVFPLADAFRRVDGGIATRSGFFTEYLSNPDYDAFWQVANAVSLWTEGMATPLRQFAGSVFFWVPRAVWADKPTDTGILLAEYRGYSFDNLSAPIWAEAIVNGGLIAVIILFVIYGLSARLMDTRSAAALSRSGAWAIAGAVLPVFTTILLRGSLLQATGPLLLTVGCILFVTAGRGPFAVSDDLLGSQPGYVRPIPIDSAAQPFVKTDAGGPSRLRQARDIE